eukprot:4279356-Prymnesium_polylepis.1
MLRLHQSIAHRPAPPAPASLVKGAPEWWIVPAEAEEAAHVFDAAHRKLHVQAEAQIGVLNVEPAWIAQALAFRQSVASINRLRYVWDKPSQIGDDARTRPANSATRGLEVRPPPVLTMPAPWYLDESIWAPRI